MGNTIQKCLECICGKKQPSPHASQQPQPVPKATTFLNAPCETNLYLPYSSNINNNVAPTYLKSNADTYQYESSSTVNEGLSINQLSRIPINDIYAQVSITLTLLNKSIKKFDFDKNKSFDQLNNYIYSTYYQQDNEVQPEQLMLLIGNSPTNPAFLLKSLGKRSLKIAQRMAEPWEIRGLDGNKNKKDIIGEKGGANMSCGHFFSRRRMREFIDAEVSQGKTDIRCPDKQRQAKCNFLWNKKQWRLVAGFTRTEANAIDEKLSLNLCQSLSRIQAPLQDQSQLIVRKPKQMPVSQTDKILMSCGHNISSNDLKSFVQAQLLSGKNEINCPNCSKAWGLKELRQAGHYTQEQINAIGQNLSINMSNKILNKNRPSSLQKTVGSKISQRFQASFGAFNIQPNNYFQNPFARSRNLQPIRNQSSLRSVSLPGNVEEESISINVTLEDKSMKTINVSKKSTILELKKIIYENYYSELIPQQTIILVKDQKVKNNRTLNSLNLSLNQPIIQRKAEFWQIQGIVAFKEKLDPISKVDGVVQMSCSHEIGPISLRYLVSSQLSSKKSSINCPYRTANDELCDRQWTKRQILLVGGYTRKEMNQIDEKLSLNAVFNTTKECPICKISVSLSGLKTIRVKCPKCSSEFCFTCLSPWKGSSIKCESDICNTLRTQVAKSPLTRPFDLKNRSTGKKILVMAPQTRACPRCRALIINPEFCKHTRCKCMNLQFSFCFVCLGLLENGKWPCGGPYDYCGYVAPNQKFD